MLRNILALVTGTIVLILGFVFSLIFIAIFVALGVLAGGFFWWKTRKLRKAMREQTPGGHVIEGEVVVVDEAPPGTLQALPRVPPGGPDVSIRSNNSGNSRNID